ncbi:MAG TPA: DUF1343 domain-containing protein [Candidatus Deferrimicrobium sp.]|nr:DUF1343 domain-containing protein [Candidatus Deferrimicrobium sp.]
MEIGIDVFKEDTDTFLKERNIVLITGSANVDSVGEPVYRVVKKAVGKRLKAIWSLQHGFFIDKQDNMIFSDSFYWKDLDLEVKSLYGENLLPRPEWLAGIEALVIDLFDVGTRVYTFVNHVIMLLKYLSGRNIDIVVLDRPNPLNGLMLEGNIMDPGYFSIVGQLPVPMRHGLTGGEYLSYALSYYDLDLQLEVVQVRDWERGQFFQGIWTYPSPNMPTFQTALVYPGAVMLEGTNLSEGRGTTRPFELVGAPFINQFQLVHELEKLKLKDVTFIPVFFKPEFSKYAGEICRGVLVNPHSGVLNEFKSFMAYYEIIRQVKAAYPEYFKWKEPPYEFEYRRPPIDMICGSDLIRETIEANGTFNDIEPEIAAGVEAYIETVTPFLLY